MAFSKDFELEVDSTYRSNTSISTSDFQYQLPYSFPTVKGQTRISLSSAFVPESFHNIPTTTIYSFIGVGPGPFPSFTIPGRRYTASQLATTMQTLATAAGYTTLTISYSATQNKFTFTDSASTYPLSLGTGVTSGFFEWLGFSTPSFIQLVLTVPKISDFDANMNLDRERALYIRIANLDNKIMLPWIPSQIFTFAIPFVVKTPNGEYVYQPNEKKLLQTLYLNSNQLRSNSQMKISLVWRDGTTVDLNGRNWKFSLKVQQDESHSVKNMFID
jgi:hypothetical protein